MVKIIVSDVVITALVIIVIGLSVWIAVSNRPNRKSEKQERVEDYLVHDNNLRLSPKALSTEGLSSQQEDIGYQLAPNQTLDVSTFAQSPSQPTFTQSPDQSILPQTLDRPLASPKQVHPIQAAPSTPKQDDNLQSRAYDPNEQSSSLIDSDAVVEDELVEGIFGIYLETDKGRVASASIENTINESTNISITVPEGNSDNIVILCRGYKNYTYNWYRDGGGKRQGCGIVEDEQITIPCEFRPGQSFCNIRICLLGHESEVNLDLKLEE